jgi:uncharacterized protein (TIGR00251 family)
VAPHRFVPERLAADAGGDNLHGRLSLAKPGDAKGRGEVGRRMLDRMLDVLLGYLDLEANAALRQLFDLRPHWEPLCQKRVGLPDMARVELTVSSGAARSELVGRHGGGWRARIAAPPERSRANSELVALLAETLGVRLEEVTVVAGRAGRRKFVEVEGLSAAEIDRRLAAAL